MDKEKHMVGKIKLITSAITTYLFLSILIMITWIALDPPTPATALSFTLAPSSSTWAIGTKGASQASTSPTSPTTWTVTNDSSPAVTESITIQVTGVTWTSAASAWTIAGTGSNVYALTLKSPGDTVMGTTATTLASGLAGGGQKGFGLAFTTPSTSTEQGAHTLTVTLTAVAYSPCGVGAYYNTYCWYLAPDATSCTTACQSHGSALTGMTIPAATQIAACIALFGESPNFNIASCTWPAKNYTYALSPTYDKYGTATFDAACGLSSGNKRICPCTQ